MRLIFVRHGEPDYDNDSLTENGKDQAEKTAKRLKDEGITAIYASPMGRAMETASPTARTFGLSVEPLDFMHEIDWGGDVPYNGHPWSLSFRFLAENPECITGDDWRKHPFFQDNKCLEYYDKVSNEFDKFLERFGLVRKNGLYEVADTLDEKVGVTNEIVALFAHGGSGAVMFSHILNLPFPYVLAALPYGVCSVSMVDFVPQCRNVVVPRLSLFNDMGHLGNVKSEPLHFDK